MKKNEDKQEKLSLQQQADKILEIAYESGIQSNFFFITTFKRYQVQLSVLSQLEAEIKNTGMLVTKEYVKGRQNVYTNPAIDQYNKTSTSANNTVSTLINIIKQLRPEDPRDDKKLSDFMDKLMR